MYIYIYIYIIYLCVIYDNIRYTPKLEWTCYKQVTKSSLILTLWRPDLGAAATLTMFSGVTAWSAPVCWMIPWWNPWTRPHDSWLNPPQEWSFILNKLSPLYATHTPGPPCWCNLSAWHLEAEAPGHWARWEKGEISNFDCGESALPHLNMYIYI